MIATLRSIRRYALCVVRPRVLVLIYHHVCPPGRTLPAITISPECFEEQMAFLNRSGLAISLDEVLRGLALRRLRRGGCVLVTLDDAGEDVIRYVAPILRRQNVPATVFVPTGFCRAGKEYWWNVLHVLAAYAEQSGIDLHRWMAGKAGISLSDPRQTLWTELRKWSDERRSGILAEAREFLGDPDIGPTQRAMRWEELESVSSDGLITLGAHTVTHPMLEAIDDEQLGRELNNCRTELEELRGYRNVFAYPYGDAAVITSRTRDAVVSAGFDAAFANLAGSVSPDEDRFVLGRVGVEDCTLGEFRWVVDHHLCGSGLPRIGANGQEREVHGVAR